MPPQVFPRRGPFSGLPARRNLGSITPFVRSDILSGFMHPWILGSGGDCAASQPLTCVITAEIEHLPALERSFSYSRCSVDGFSSEPNRGLDWVGWVLSGG